VDIFDASDYDFLLPRRVRKAIGLSLMIGIALVPPVRVWYVGQIEHHAEHITREIVSTLASVSPIASQQGKR
jgi:hypothetical protein